jgi:YHS domain-containing protein
MLVPLLYAAPLQAQSQPKDSEPSGASIERIENKYVCMVNDQHYQDIQIDVPVGEKIYYGCCQGCVTTLKMDPESRTATDPITGKQVDKATAVVGALPNGSVRYFESEETLEQFRTQGEGTADS